MSFVPNPTQANASSNKVNTPAAGAAAAASLTPDEMEVDSVFKIRTFDVYWVEKQALMYRDGTTTVSEKLEKSKWTNGGTRWIVVAAIFANTLTIASLHAF